jgi:hypothetical protein
MKITKLPNGSELWEYTNGNKDWSLNGKFHREDGPAIEYANGDKVWFINGKWHREDGPAIERVDGDKEWYINNEKLPCKTQKQFLQLMKLKAFW